MNKNFGRIDIPKNFRPYFTKLLYEWADRKPDSTNPYINQIRNLQKIEMETIEKGQKELIAPEGTELNFLTLRLIELYELEDQDSLLVTLERLFPNNSYFQNNQSFEDYFNQISKSLSSMGWTSVGVLYKDKKPIGPINCYLLKTLPSEVSYIHLHLHKVLPSLLLLTFDVHFSTKTNEIVREIHESQKIHCLQVSQIHLHEKIIFPSFNMYGQEKEKAVVEFFQTIQQKIEKSIKPLFAGEFFSQSKNKTKLPAIQVFILTRKNEARLNYTKWSRKAFRWLESYGIRPFFGAFYNKQIAFISASNKSSYDPETPNRLIVFREGYLKDVDTSVYGGKDNSTILYTIKYFLDDILIPVAIIEYLKFSISNIETTRRKIFNTINKGDFFAPSLRKLLTEYSKFKNFHRSLERLLLEFNQNKDHFGYFMSNIKPKDLFFSNFQSDRLEDKLNLHEAFYKHISMLSDIAQSHIRFISDEFLKFIESQNIYVMYRLQNLMLWITLITLIVSMVSILSNWEIILSIIRFLIK